ncbi:transporter substrate-binding domain-containing protein [uncultured Psychromonas sp.]|uniref:transporter substrate-binding domain-containing protein n=1 Tax=uncultured Psychromonas sp. TaxID=173974 RepID=UPI00261DBB5C|nr:transporter substrate-binding domain-containing protein [uncultured Psychromonas sp.]
MTLTKYKYLCSLIALLLICFYSSVSTARDLEQIKADGVLRHIGVPYANFITLYSEGDRTVVGGLDAELMQGFAKHLGLEYEFITASWSNAFTLLTGRNASYINNQLQRGHIDHGIEGDVIANGATILPWRSEVVDFASDYFPSAVWLVAKVESDLIPITPTGSLEQDIITVKKLIKNHDVLAMKQTCLDPDLYNLYDTEANIILPTTELKLNEMIPAILNNDAESTLLDVPDTLIALQKWPGEIKVIGPVSDAQAMAVAFRKDSPQLREAFNQYLEGMRKSGEYNQLVNKYYPSVFNFYPEFFKIKNQ